MKKVFRVIINAALLMVFWLALSGLEPASVGLGVLIVAICYMIFGKRLTILRSLRYEPRALLAFGGFCLVFIQNLLASNLDLALRVINPRLPIAPGILEVETALRAPLAIMLISYAITLTPGTIMIECAEGKLFVHAINVQSETAIAQIKDTIAQYESYLMRLFK